MPTTTPTPASPRRTRGHARSDARAVGRGTGRLAWIVLAVLTVAGLVAMHGLSWGHDTGCHTATAAGTGADSSSAHRAHGHGASTGQATRASGAHGVVFGAAATVFTAVTPSTPSTPSTVFAQGAAEHGCGPMLMCVAVLSGLAVLALLLAAAYRLRGHPHRRPRTRSAPGAQRGRAPPLPYLSPRLPVLCVSRT